MLHNLSAVIKSENVDASVIVATGPSLVAMKDDEITLRKCALEVRFFAGVVARQPFEIFNKCFFAASNMRVVLDINIARIRLNGFARLTLVNMTS